MITIDLSRIITAADKRAEAARVALETRQTEARAYLAETDWYVTRLAETGAAIPEEISAERHAARASLQ